MGLGVIFVCETGFSYTAQKVVTNLYAVPCSINNRDKQLGDGVKGSKQVSRAEFHGQIDVGSTARDSHQEPCAREHVKGSEKSGSEEMFFILFNPKFPRLI